MGAKIHVYTICWNEEKILPFFIRHYQQFADKIVFYDNESTDNSRQIIESSDKCFYRSYESGNEIRDDLYKDIKNNSWKESRVEADFIIVVDCDEFVYSKRGLLRDIKILHRLGFSIFRPTGYDMIADGIDWSSSKPITQLIRKGVPFSWMNKPCIFNPSRVKEIKFTYGAHSCSAEGWKLQYRQNFLGRFVSKLFDIKLCLLHYKNLSLEHSVKRHEDLKNRLSAFNVESKLGSHYLRTREEIKEEYDSRMRESIEVI